MRDWHRTDRTTSSTHEAPPRRDRFRRASMSRHLHAIVRVGLLCGLCGLGPSWAEPPNSPAALKPVPVRTGVIARNKARQDLAPLRIVTPKGATNYVVKFVDAGRGSQELLIYIKGGETYQGKVPLGVYKIRGAYGDVWYGAKDLFGPDTSVFKLVRRRIGPERERELFTFSREGNRLRGHEIRLTKHVDGNLQTNPIARTEF